MMNQNRMKRLVLLVSALAMAAQLAACSSGAPAETTPKASESGTQPTTPPETSSTQPGGTIADITVAPPETSGLPVVIDTTSDTPVSVFETTTGVQTSGQDTQNVDTTPIDTGAVLVIGNSAMEHYYGVDSALESYAGTVSSIKQQLPDVNVYAMFCPSAVEFCAPAKYQAGTRSQQRAMNVIYNALQNGAVGVDTWAAEEVLLLKTRYPDLKLYAAVPYKNQYARLYNWQKERYFRILSRCEKVFLISEDYHKSCFYQRNAFMVNHATVIISVYDGGRGGTANTIALAEKKGIDIYNINPNVEPVSFY